MAAQSEDPGILAVAVCDRPNPDTIEYPSIVVRKGATTKVSTKIKEVSKTIDLRGLRERKTFTHQAIQYHCLVGDGGALLIATTQREDDVSRRLAFRLLEELDKMWSAKRRGASMQDFDERVLRLADQYSDRTRDAIGQVAVEVDVARDVLATQVQKLLDKGEKVEQLDAAADEYRTEAEIMRKQAAEIRRKKRIRCVCIAIVVFILVALGAVFGSYFGCRESTDINHMNWDKCVNYAKNITVPRP